MPVRDWPDERIAACVGSFSRLPEKLLPEIIVVDFGSAQPVKLGRLNRRVRVLRLEAAQWSLAEAINAGVLNASCDLVAKTDADVLIDPNSASEIMRILSSLRGVPVGLVMAQAIDLPSSLSVSQATRKTADELSSLGRLRPRWGQGGLVFFTTGLWNAIGGFDSRFTGWGNEDNDFAERVRRSGSLVRWADRSRLRIFHIWHPPSFAATGILVHRARNQKLAKDDKSVFRPLTFRHSNAAVLARPAIEERISPLVTLGIATTARQNRDRMIVEAINSFRDQADNDFEILVVDNGSSDEATNTLRRALGRIKWSARIRIETLKRGSIPAARNLISRVARGRYICVVDDDDIALPNRLVDHLRPFATDGGIHGTHGGWIDFDESTGVIERNQGKKRAIGTLLKGSGKITAHPASFYRTDVMKAMPYDESFELGSDFDLALRLANNGFEVAHTNSYVTLRRYHSANVTVTGQSNQVSNGAHARSRTLASFDWQRHDALEEEARTSNAEIYCRNKLSIESIAQLIPGYSGEWHLYAPIDAISASSARASQELGSNAQPASDGILEQLTRIAAGDLCTRFSGLNQPIYYRTAVIPGLERARKLKRRIEDLLATPVQINSVRQSEIDREVAFDWKQMSIGPGERVLRSDRTSELADLLERLENLPTDSLLRSSISVLSDFDEQGECYYLATAPAKGLHELQRMSFELQRRLKLSFRQVASLGVVSELTPATRSH